jgi:phospholipid/cholesterol/gamma-HCH transport system substrate-binding protein
VRSRWNLPIYIVYLLISIGVIGFILAQVGLPAPWSHPYSVTATFSDAADILTNNEVFMNGVKVGHVGNVTVENGKARVELVVDDASALPLHQDASAEVRKKNLLGETYIDVQRGSGSAELRSGGSIPMSHTLPITEIDQVLAIFDPETVQRLQLLINALGDTTTNNGHNMNSEASSLNQFLTQLNGPAIELSVRQQQVQDIVLELQRFYALLANQRTQIRDEFGTWNQVMAQMAAQEASIGSTIQQADQLLQNVSTLITGETGNLRSVIGNLPASLNSANSFLTQSNQVLKVLAPYRQYIDDIFPGLGTSFSDADPLTLTFLLDNGKTVTQTFGNGQHFWSIYSATCPPKDAPSTDGTCTGNVPSAYTPGQAPSTVWAAYSSTGGSQ